MDRVVFTLQLNSDGSYVFTQFRQLDHLNATDPNDAIQLNFGVQIADVDGDLANGTIVIHVLDDAPVAYDDWSGVEEDGRISGNVMQNDERSEDVSNTVSQVMFGGTTYNVPTTGVVTIVGQYGTFTMAASGVWTYQATAEDPNGHERFEYTLRDREGDTDTAVLDIVVTPDGVPVAVTGEGIVDETNLDTGSVVTTGNLQIDAGIDGYGGVRANGSFNATGSLTSLSHAGVPVEVTHTATGYVGMAGSVRVFDLSLHTDGTYTFTLHTTLDHANPLDPNDAIRLNFEFGVTALDADGDTVDGTLSITVLDDAPVAYDDWSGVEEDGRISGNVMQNDERSEDVSNTVSQVMFGGTTYNVPTTGVVTIVGQYGTFTMAASGVWTYQATAEDPNGHERFEYTLRDREGDTDTAVLDIVVTPDGVPVAVTGEGIVDETNLDTGSVVTTGNLQIDAGIDGYGGVRANGSFNATGSLTSLSHAGVPVEVTHTATGYVGMAGSVRVFDLSLHTDGTYTFTLHTTLDHANPLDPNDAIRLNFEFGVTALDADGDTVDGTLSITVLDDAPVALDDSAQAEEGRIIAGDVLANDLLSQDVTNTVVRVIFEGQSYNVPAKGQGFLTVTGHYGTLTMGWNGAWSYHATSAEDDRDATEVFTYVLSDREGDTDTAELTILIPEDDQPVIVNGTRSVDETGGFDTVTGTVSVNYGGD
ncbi:MAG TPA: Ig-like domain-containing protein, partial [Chlorobiota bacterium]|nr:Ig-like domain-containing protein [Chlorobiota bacterium]